MPATPAAEAAPAAPAAPAAEAAPAAVRAAAAVAEPAAEASGPPVCIVIRGATNLRKADVVGQSDPYCLVRLGAKGTAFRDKPATTEFRSRSITNSANPSPVAA